MLTKKEKQAILKACKRVDEGPSLCCTSLRWYTRSGVLRDKFVQFYGLDRFDVWWGFPNKRSNQNERIIGLLLFLASEGELG